MPLLLAAQYPQPLGRLLGLPAGRPQPMVGQEQLLPRGRQLLAVPPRSGQGRQLLAGGLVVGAGLLAGLLGLGRPPGGQLQLPGRVRWARASQLSEPVAFGPQRPRG
jgi:hypothetical protein